jgi:hypothetical protein
MLMKIDSNKTKISDLVRMTCFWNCHHQVRSTLKDWKENNLKVFFFIVNFVNIYTFVHAHNQSVLMASRKVYKAVFIIN